MAQKFEELYDMDLFSNLVVRTKKEFLLKKKNESILCFNLYYTIIGSIECEIVGVFTYDPKKLPVGLTISGDSLLDWLQTRFIPKHRAYVDKILETLKTNRDDLASLLSITLGLSLTDDYWVVPTDKNYRWEDYNLYDNEFSEALASVAFTGVPRKLDKFASSPEYTTDGMLPKCWRRINGKIYLFKGGTSGFANSGLEPYSEFYAAQVAEALGVDHVYYDLTMWKDRLCSVCELFTSKEVSLVPAYMYLGRNAAEILVRTHTSGRSDLSSSLMDMIVFDWIIANQDRHLGNFGVLRDNSTGQIIKFAPLFDHGMSLLHQALDSDFNDLEDYFSIRKFTFLNLPYDSIDLIVPLVKNKQKLALENLLEFQFRKHEKYNLSDYRLEFLSMFVRERAKKLLTAINKS